MENSVFNELYTLPDTDCGLVYDDLEPIISLKAAIGEVSSSCENCPVLIEQGKHAIEAAFFYANMYHSMIHELDEDGQEKSEQANYTATLLSKFVEFADLANIEVPEEMRTATPEVIVHKNVEFISETLEIARAEALARIALFTDMHSDCLGPLKMRASKGHKTFTATLCTSDSVTEYNDEPDQYPSVVEVTKTNQL